MTSTTISFVSAGTAAAALLAGIIIAKIRLGRASHSSAVERQRIKLLESELNRCRQQLEEIKLGSAQNRFNTDEALLAASLANAKDLVIIWDLKLKPLFISASVSHFIGYAESNLDYCPLSKDVLQRYMTGISVKKVLAMLGKALEEINRHPAKLPILEAVELELVREDRSTIKTETRASFVAGPDGNAQAIISITRDFNDAVSDEGLFKRMIEDSHNAAFKLTTEGIIAYMSPAFGAICGVTPAEALGKQLAEFVHPQDRARISSTLAAFMDGRQPELLKLRLLNRASQAVSVTMSVVIDYEAERAAGMHGTISDISDMVENEDTLRQREELYRGLIENMNDISFSLDRESRYTYVSPVAEYVLGYPMHEIMGAPFKRFVYPEDLPGLEEAFTRAVEGQTVLNEFRVLKRNGVMLYFRVSARFIVEDGRIVGTTGILSDITLMKENELKLRNALEENKLLSVTDALTGCYNRGFLTEHLPYELKRAKRYHHPFAMILCDIDHFKRINDAYGHQAGDLVLKEFVSCARGLIRENMDWLARYGGEEFLLAAGETDLAGAMILAERLRKATAELNVEYSGQPIKVTASFGVACYNPGIKPEDISAEIMVNRVDRCLYAAKESGRNRVICQDMINFMER